MTTHTATVTFEARKDTNHSCKGCVGDNNIPVCQALPGCMGQDEVGIALGAQGDGVIWVVKAVA